MHDQAPRPTDGADARPGAPEPDPDILARARQPGTSQGADAAAQASARRLRRWARLVLVPVSVIGAVLSFRSLYLAAEPVFGPELASGFPLLVDALILGASLQYVAGAKVGRARAGWRLTAHAGVAGTLVLNALASHTPAEIPWHVTAPAVWSVLVELTAREVLGEWQAAHRPPADRIPARLWLTAPVESIRTWLRLARRVEGEQAAARLEVGLNAVAVEALHLAWPGRRARRARRILTRQLQAGSLPPVAVLAPLGWTDDTEALTTVTPAGVLRAALRDTLLASGQPAPAALRPGPRPRAIEARDPDGPEATHGPAATGRATTPATPRDTPPPRGLDTPPVVARDTWRDDRRDTQPGGLSPAPAGHATAAGANGVGTRHGAAENGAADMAPPAASNGRTPQTRPGQPDPGRRQPPARPTVSSGNRLADAVALLQADPDLSGPKLAAQLRGLGWEVSNRTGSRILNEALEQLPPRLSAVR